MQHSTKHCVNVRKPHVSVAGFASGVSHRRGLGCGHIPHLHSECHSSLREHALGTMARHKACPTTQHTLFKCLTFARHPHTTRMSMGLDLSAGISSRVGGSGRGGAGKCLIFAPSRHCHAENAPVSKGEASAMPHSLHYMVPCLVHVLCALTQSACCCGWIVSKCITTEQGGPSRHVPHLCLASSAISIERLWLPSKGEV